MTCLCSGAEMFAVLLSGNLCKHCHGEGIYILSFLSQPLPLFVTEGLFQSYSYSTKTKNPWSVRSLHHVTWCDRRQLTDLAGRGPDDMRKSKKPNLICLWTSCSLNYYKHRFQTRNCKTLASELAGKLFHSHTDMKCKNVSDIESTYKKHTNLLLQSGINDWFPNVSVPCKMLSDTRHQI